jgi:hypothetical protein
MQKEAINADKWRTIPATHVIVLASFLVRINKDSSALSISPFDVYILESHI